MSNSHLIIFNAAIFHVLRTEFNVVSIQFTNFIKSFLFVCFLITMIFNFIYPIIIFKYLKILKNPITVRKIK